MLPDQGGRRQGSRSRGRSAGGPRWGRRLASVKKAADAAGRKLCFMGMSLNTYLEAAWRDGRAPFDPKDLVAPADLRSHDPSSVLVVCTGSQAQHPLLPTTRATLTRAPPLLASSLRAQWDHI